MAGPVRRRGAVIGSVLGYAKAYPERGADAGVYRFRGSLSWPERTLRGGPVVEEAPQALEPRVYVVVGVVVGAARKLLAAHDAESGAVLAAQRRDRLREQDPVADLTLEIQFVVVREPQGVRLVADIDRGSACEVEAWQRLFVEVQLNREFDLAQATAAGLEDGRLEPAVDQEAAVCPGQPQIAGERANLDQLLEFERGRRDV